MSRQIAISFCYDLNGPKTRIEVPTPYCLLGSQRPSMEFWSIVHNKAIGVERLSLLGVSDPVYFFGWEEMPQLHQEIVLLEQNLEIIDFEPELKAEWLSHLVYSYHLLLAKAPKSSMPIFDIG